MPTSNHFAFTGHRLEGTPLPSAGRTRYFDTETPGLCLLVTAAGTRSFYFIRRSPHTGRTIKAKLGPFPGVEISEARSQAVALLAKVHRGEDPMAEKRDTRKTLTLGEAFEQFMVHARGKLKCPEEYAKRYKAHLSHWRGRLLSSLTRSEVQDWHQNLGKTRGIYAANRAHSTLRRAYNWCISRGGTPRDVEAVWSMISSFSGYSFAKAHSASYAMVSFQAAYLKAHAPAAFHARVVANEGGFYSPSAYLEEARRRGIRLLSPSVTQSAWRTAPDGSDAIRLGFHLVQLVSKTKAERIIEQREVAPFDGVGDFARRCCIDARTLLNLASVGALADLRPDLHHLQLLWLAETIGLLGVHRGGGHPRKRTEEAGQLRLFPAPEWTDPPAPLLRPSTPREETWGRFQALRVCVDHHPVLFIHRNEEQRCRYVAKADHGAWVVVVGVVVTSRRIAATSAKGERKAMAFVTVEDETGILETTWFPEAYRACGVVIDSGGPLRLRGHVQVEFGVRTVTVEVAEAVPWGQ